MTRRTMLKAERKRGIYPPLGLSLVEEQRELAVAADTSLANVISRVMARTDTLYYIHGGSMLSLAEELVTATRHILSIPVHVCDLDGLSLLMDIVSCDYYRISEGARTGALVLSGANIAVVEAVREYLTADRYAQARSRILRVSITTHGWDSVWKYLYNNPACLPACTTLEIFGAAFERGNPILAWTRVLRIRFVPTDVECVGETVANATATLELLRIDVKVVDCEHETVRVVNSACEVFAGRFPNMRSVRLNGMLKIVDLSHCPAVEQVSIECMSPELYAAVLTSAPWMPTRPTGNRRLYEWERDIARVHAPHLLPQIEAAATPGAGYKWAPPVHRSFTVTLRTMVGALMMGITRLMEEDRVAAFDPAMLEEALREIPVNLLLLGEYEWDA